MLRQELLQKSSALLGRFAHEVKVANAMGQFDINSIAEDFLIPILGSVFDCPNLTNQNRIQMNYPAVDLGCNSSKMSIQITSDSSSTKIIETLEKFETHNLSKKFDKLYVYVITERQASYFSKKLKEKVDTFSAEFEASSNIIDYRDLAKLICNLSDEKLEIIIQHLETAFKKSDTNLYFRNHLEDFLGVSQQKIELEKQSKKYIPTVFIETSKIKDDVRYFANPMFFYRKIDDEIQRIQLNQINDLLIKSKIEPLKKDFQKALDMKKPGDLVQLRKRLDQQHETLESFRGCISPFTWLGKKTERFEPDENLRNYWKVFKHSIQSNGFDVYSSVKEIINKINITQAKIFLVTGMAGQGKTNFVCDLVENQFRAFEIPTVFIPARLLNDYPSPNRILAYIKNNRFAPEVNNLQELFALLNNVASECRKPFVIAIDGINEVTDLDGFIAELRIFLEALYQYDFLKILITCRSEFFDHKFAGVFEPQFGNQLHRVHDLRSNMSNENRSRLFKKYLVHFKITTNLSKSARDFLKNDLILLRIFCEIYEGQNIGYVQDIYKGDMFEDFLKMKIHEFPHSQHQSALNSLYKICSRMLENEIFSQISVAGFEEEEQQIIEKLIGEDIILRREIPSSDLASMGVENISFTYDELRDFLLAYYTVKGLGSDQADRLSEIFEKLPSWPVYEGFFRYLYILARKFQREDILTECENYDDFNKHYINNLTLLSTNIQTSEDVARIKYILMNSTDKNEIEQVAWFLFRKHDLSAYLNIQILLDHLNQLNDVDCKQFFASMFCNSSDYAFEKWKSNLSEIVEDFLNFSDKKKLEIEIPVLALLLHFATYANWDQKEATFNCFSRLHDSESFSKAILACHSAVSDNMKRSLIELSERRSQV